MVRSNLAAAWVAFVVSFAAPAWALDTTSEPTGILAKATQEKLWNAYKTAKVCMEHPTYDPPTSQVVPSLKPVDFAGKAWTSPFTKVRGAPECDAGGNPRLVVPPPISTVKLNEAYGERQADVDAAATWFRDLTAYHRLTGDPVAAEQLKQGLLAWAKGNGLSKGIHVSYGKRTVDYQMMTAILSFEAAAAELADTFTSDERAVIGPWLNDLVKQSAASTWREREDNKAFMRTYMALLWGLMVGDDKPVQDAIVAYKLAIHDMRPDGSWPIDSQRGGMGLSYGSASTSHIVMMAVLLKEARNIDLFDYQVDGRSVHNSVDWMVAAIKDPAATNRIYAIPCPDSGDRFGGIDTPNTHQFEEAGYLVAYAERFPERESSKFILAHYSNAKALDSEKNGGAAACQFALKGREVAFAPLEAPKPPPEFPKPKFNIRTFESEAYVDGTWVDSSFTSSASGKAPLGQFNFNIRANYSASGEFGTFSFVVDKPLGKTISPALAACNPETDTFSDGQKRIVLSFAKQENHFVANKNVACVLAALPKEPAALATFLLDSFRDIAIGMMKTGDVDGVKQKGLQKFISQVAIGEITLSR